MVPRRESAPQEVHVQILYGGIGFVNRIAEAAEKAGHHPDIAVNYNLVTLSLSTHSEGGVTERDFQLAKEIDGLAH